MDILPVDQAENNLFDAEFLLRDELAEPRPDVVRVRAARALLHRRRAEFDAAFLAALRVAA